MLPKYHISLGFIFSIFFTFIFKIGLIGFAIVFFSSFLIDVDHYLFYIFKKKKWSLGSAYNFFLTRRKANIKKAYKTIEDPTTHFFHGFEVLTILGFFGLFFSHIFWFILTGFLFHLILDVLEQIYYGQPIAKVFLILDFIRFKKKDGT